MRAKAEHPLVLVLATQPALDADPLDVLGLISEVRKMVKAGKKSGEAQFCVGADRRFDLRRSDDPPPYRVYRVDADQLTKAAEVPAPAV